jgi:integrase
MTEKRVTVWVQRFKDRKHLMLQWIDPETGKRKSRSAETDDPDKADRARSDLEYELNHGLHEGTTRMAWDRFRERFEDQYLPNVRPSTQRNYRNALDLFEQICSPRNIRSVKASMLSAFVAGLRKLKVRGGRTGMLPSTISVRLQLLHGVFSWGTSQGYLPRCPKFPDVKVPRRKPKPVPEEAFERLLAKVTDAQMQTFLLCGWLAGLRLAEAIRLDWEETDEAPWVDLPRNRIWLPAEFVKADEDQWVPLDPDLREALLALPRHGRKVFRFVASDGHSIRDNAVAALVSRLAKEAGVKLTMRVLRRGFGCRYAAEVPAQVLQKLMRHSSITTTMDYYANVDRAAEEAVLGRRNRKCNTPSLASRPAQAQGGYVTEGIGPLPETSGEPGQEEENPVPDPL